MIFQRLPKKMRRRVMSTTVKRMPKDLRAAHKKSVFQNIELKLFLSYSIFCLNII